MAIPSISTDSTRAFPRIRVTEEVQLGWLDTGTVKAIQFPLRNLGDATLEIHSIHSSCACIRFWLPGLRVPPRTEIPFHLRLAVLPTHGKLNYWLRLDTNDEVSSPVIIGIQARVNNPYILEPDDGLDLGKVESLQVKTASVGLRRQDGRPFVIREMLSPRNDIRLHGMADAEQRNWTIVATTVPPFPPLFVVDTFDVFTNESDAVAISIPLLCRGTGNLSLLPSYLYLSAADLPGSIQEIHVRRTGTRPVRPLAVHAPAPDARVSLDPLANDAWRIRFVLPENPERLHGKYLEVLTDDPQFPRLELPIRWSAMPE